MLSTRQNKFKTRQMSMFNVRTATCNHTTCINSY